MLLLSLLLLALFSSPSFAQGPPPSLLDAEVVHSDLGFPNSFAIAKDGTTYVTSLAGNFVFQLKNGTKNVVTQFTSLSSYDGSGPLGVTVDPTYPANPWIYVFVGGELVDGKVRATVYRFTIAPNGQGLDKTIILRLKVSPAAFETGGRIAFGPDGKLYVGTGNMVADYPFDPSLSDPSFYEKVQKPRSQVGKLLRVNKDGSFPNDNPYPNGVWAMGVRNTYGFSWDKKNNNLWEAEPGPDCNDEINLVTRGANLGWGPKFSCTGQAPRNTNRNGKDITMPKVWLSAIPELGPRPLTYTGVAVCNACNIPDYENRLFAGTFQPGIIFTYKIGGAKRDKLDSQEISYFNGAPVLGVETGPSGSIYFSDGAGFIKKLKPKAA